MDRDGRREGARGFAAGLLLGLVLAGLPLVLLLLHAPPTVVVPAPSGSRSEATEGAAAVDDRAGSGAKVEDAATSRSAAEEPKEEAGPGDSPPPPVTEDGTAAPDSPEDEDPRAHEERLRKALEERLLVRILDGTTGEALGGVSFSIFVGTGGGGGITSGFRTKADGTAVADPLGLLEMMRMAHAQHGAPDAPMGTVDDPLLAQVRLRLPGYRPWNGPATGKSLDIRFERDAAPAAFGAVAGRVLGPDGTPWTRPVEVSLQDPIVLDSLTTWTLPGPDGRFHLSGIPAGTWGAKVDDAWGPRTRIEVAPGGTAEVELRVPGEEEGARDGELPEKRRPVTVTVADRDLPFGAAILLQGEWGSPMRTALASGVASFPGVPAGGVRVVLRRPDGVDESFSTDIPAGEGALEIPFPAPKPR